jgi:hypothetical protein
MKVPTAAALVLVPILGATFLMFLPLIGFVLFLQAMALPVVRLFKGGTAVKNGYYLNLSRWAIEPVSRDGERLPEGKGEWIAIPAVAALALTPVLGATFLMLLPLNGVVLSLQALASPVVRMFQSSAADLAATVSPGWQPGEAHFTGKSPERAGIEEEGPIAQDERLDALEREIEQKRRQA